MFTFFTVLACIAVLASILLRDGDRGSSGNISGGNYDPIRHQVLRENVLKDP